MSVISTIEYSHRSPQGNTGPWLIMGQKIMFLVPSHVHCKLLSLCFADGCSDGRPFCWYTGFLGILLVCVMKLLSTWKLVQNKMIWNVDDFIVLQYSYPSQEEAFIRILSEEICFVFYNYSVLLFFHINRISLFEIYHFFCKQHLHGI